jgi:hypothetical protein
VFYKTGSDLEEAVFGKRSAGLDLVRKFWGQSVAFGPQIRSLLGKFDSFCPDTKIGQTLYRQIVRQLRRCGIDPQKLIFLPTVGTEADAHHYTDGLFYLPSLDPYLVTVDAYNVPERNLDVIREMFQDSFSGQFYSKADFQSDLFRYKKGFAEWRRSCRVGNLPEEDFLKVDFRQYSDAARPENHFILTPGNVGTYQARRSFAKMVAGYFVKVSSKKMA